MNRAPTSMPRFFLRHCSVRSQGHARAPQTEFICMKTIAAWIRGEQTGNWVD